MPSPNLEDLLVELAQALADQPDVPAALVRALRKAGKSAIQNEAINIGGDLITATGGSVIINRSDQVQVTVNYPDAAELVEAIVLQARQQIIDERAIESRQHINEYLAAVRNYCANLPYLILHDISPPKALHEVYVPLRARPQPRKGKKSEAEESGMRDETPRAPVSIAEVMRNHEQPHVLVLGEPGAGKSTLLRQLAERAWDEPRSIGLNTPHLPILVPLWRLARANGSLDSRLSHALASELSLTHDLPPGFFTDWPTQTGTRWLFLLDALDEVPTDQRPQLMQWLRGIFKNIGQHRIVITTRPAGYIRGEFDDPVTGPAQLRHYELLPFTSEQIGEFALKWFDAKAAAFKKELERLRVGDLRGTPLLLTIAAKVFLERDTLPERRSGLYRQFVDIWLNEAKQRGLEADLGERVYKVAKLTLASLAQVIIMRPSEVSETTLKEEAAAFLREKLSLSEEEAKADGAKFVDVMARRSGVFVGRGNTYSFIHPTFCDYLFAYLLVTEWGEDFQSKAPIFLKDRWRYKTFREVSLFVLGLLSDQGADVSNLLKPILDELYNTQFTGVALAEGVTVNLEVSNRIVDGLLDLARFGTRWGAEQAFSLLGQIRNNDRVADGLLELSRSAVTDRESWRRVRAAEVLKELGHSDDSLAWMRETSIGDWQRVQGAKVLGDLGQVDQAKQIHLALVRDEAVNYWVRIQAIKALQDLDQMDDLLALTRDATLNPDVRMQATQSLAESGRVNDLLTLADDTTVDDWARASAAGALVELGWMDEAIQTLLTIAVNETATAEVRVAVAETLVRIGYLSEAKLVLSALAQNPRVKPSVRERAGVGLLQSGFEEEAAQAFLILADDETTSIQVRMGAAEALKELDRVNEAAPILLAIASDTEVETDIRLQATMTLWQLGRENETAQACLALVSDSAIGLDIRQDAAEVLERLGRSVEAKQAYLNLACDTTVRADNRLKAIVKVVELNGADEAVPILLALACDATVAADVRMSAAKALKRLNRRPETVQAYLVLARDPAVAALVRIDAVEVLVRLGQADEEELVPILSPLTSDAEVDAGARLQAAMILWQLGLKNQAAGACLALANDEAVTIETRVDAAEILAREGWRDEAIPVLLTLARSEAMPVGARERATVVLWELGQEDEAAQACLALALDATVGIEGRVAAAEALTRLDRLGEAILSYLSLTRDETIWAWRRLEAAEELKKLSQGENVASIVFALAHKDTVDSWVRVEVAEALGDLGQVDESVSILSVLASDQTLEPVIRSKARLALSKLDHIQDFTTRL